MKHVVRFGIICRDAAQAHMMQLRSVQEHTVAAHAIR
jgi:hypothetical protein